MRIKAAFFAFRNPGIVGDGIGVRKLTTHLYGTNGVAVVQTQITAQQELKLHVVELNQAQRALIRNTIPALQVRK